MMYERLPTQDLTLYKRTMAPVASLSVLPKIDVANGDASVGQLFDKLVDQAVAADRIDFDTGEYLKEAARTKYGTAGYVELSDDALATISDDVLAYGVQDIEQADLHQAGKVLTAIYQVQDAIFNTNLVYDGGDIGVLDPTNSDFVTAASWLAAWKNQAGHIQTTMNDLADLGYPPTLSDVHDVLEANGFTNFDNATAGADFFNEYGNILPLIEDVADWITPVDALLNDASSPLMVTYGDIYNNPIYYWSPLVLDISGDGISLVSKDSANSVYWDIDDDGVKEHAGWVSGETGLLALDRNDNGVIDNNSELFGNQPSSGIANGFAQLAELDTNDDGHITSADDQFGDLRVWIDTNGDAISQPDELHYALRALASRISTLATAM